MFSNLRIIFFKYFDTVRNVANIFCNVKEMTGFNSFYTFVGVNHKNKCIENF